MFLRISGNRVAALVTVCGLALSTSEALAHAKPQLRVHGAEVSCDSSPARLTLHGQFGNRPDRIELVLDLPAGPTDLIITFASSSQIDAELPGCDPPGTYRLTVADSGDDDR